MLNKNIKKMRLRKGLTLLEVANFLGIKESTVQRYESGQIKNIKYGTICKLSELFNCDPCYLMGWDSQISNGNINNSYVVQGNKSTSIVHSNENCLTDKQSNELLHIFNDLPVKGQTMLLSYAYELEQKFTQK